MGSCLAGGKPLYKTYPFFFTASFLTIDKVQEVKK